MRTTTIVTGFLALVLLGCGSGGGSEPPTVAVVGQDEVPVGGSIQLAATTDNGTDGIESDSASLVKSNTATGNGNNGLEVGEGDLVRNNKANDNDDDGIEGDDKGSTITKNTTNDNGDDGIQSDDQGIMIVSNTAKRNGTRAGQHGNGIASSGDSSNTSAENVWEKNRADDNDEDGLDAVILACAGLDRLGRSDAITERLVQEAIAALAVCIRKLKASESILRRNSGSSSSAKRRTGCVPMLIARSYIVRSSQMRIPPSPPVSVFEACRLNAPKSPMDPTRRPL